VEHIFEEMPLRRGLYNNKRFAALYTLTYTISQRTDDRI